jgi:hypothetical protein
VTFGPQTFKLLQFDHFDFFFPNSITIEFAAEPAAFTNISIDQKETREAYIYTAHAPSGAERRGVEGGGIWSDSTDKRGKEHSGEAADRDRVQVYE